MQKVTPDLRSMANPDIHELADGFQKLHISLGQYLKQCDLASSSQIDGACADELLAMMSSSEEGDRAKTPTTVDVNMLMPFSPEARQVRKSSYGTF